MDQVIVQRVLSAKSVLHGRGGTILSAYLKLLPPFLFAIPGIIAYVLYPTQVEADPDRSYAILVMELLPTGLRGMMVAAMLAAMMSSLASGMSVQSGRRRGREAKEWEGK
tara:strand:- start:2782 stop:3111 length:330 start_codon:yes stop_codon:yes gene_type:complete